MADVKCPGCDLELPESELRAQVTHVSENHPEIVSRRLLEVGFVPFMERACAPKVVWFDLLAE